MDGEWYLAQGQKLVDGLVAIHASEPGGVEAVQSVLESFDTVAGGGGQPSNRGGVDREEPSGAAASYDMPSLATGPVQGALFEA